MRRFPFPRQIAVFAVAAALTLGASPLALAPVTAHAGPLNPKPGPSLTPDLVATVRTGDAKQRLQEIQFTVTMKNQGSLTAKGASVVVEIPDGFTDIKISDSMRSWCTLDGNTVRCGGQGLDGGQSTELYFRAKTPGARGAYTVTAIVDPDNLVRELKENNNVATGTLLVV